MQWAHYVETTRKRPIDHIDLSGILIKGDQIEQGPRLLNWNFTILAVLVVHVRSSVTCELYCFYISLISLQCPYWWFSNVICGMHHITCISPHKSCLYLKINSQVPFHECGQTTPISIVPFDEAAGDNQSINPSGFREEAFWYIFPIGSNVNLSSAIATILNFISEQKT